MSWQTEKVAVLKRLLIIPVYRQVTNAMLLCVLFVADAGAQVSGNLSFKQLSVNEGLSHSDVTAMVQDSSGFLWLGTHNGLNKYDGHSVQIFKNNPTDSNSLSDNRISVLHAGQNGKLWIGTERYGLSVFDERLEKFIHVNFDLGRRGKTAEAGKIWVSGIIEGGDGIIWVACKRQGLFAITTNANGSVKIVDHLEPAENNTPLVINAIVQANDKRIWLATDKGVFAFHKSAKTVEKAAFRDNDIPVTKIISDHRGSIWLVRRDGLFRVTGLSSNQLGEPVLQKIGVDSAITKVETVFQDKNENVWVGTLRNGVYRLLPPSSSVNTDTDWKAEKILSGSGNFDFTGSFINVKCFLEDKFGLLWIGTAGGGAVYSGLKNKMFNTITTRLRNGHQFAEDSYIGAIYSEPGRLWLGTRRGLALYNPSAETADVYLQDKTIAAIYKDLSSTYWIAGSGPHDGLWSISKSHRNFVPVPFGNQKYLKLSAKNLTAITEDKLQRLWVATYGNGINIISRDRKQITYLKKQEGKSIASNQVTHLYTDRFFPFVWVSYRDAGVDRIDISNDSAFVITHYKHIKGDKKSLSGNFVWNVRRGRDSVIWIATLGAGLNKMQTDSQGRVSFVHYTMNEGLKDNDIESMEEDADGNLWLAGFGLTRFNPKTGAIAFFDYNDGLQSNAFKVGSSFKDKYGRLYFGGINGLNYFDPSLVVTGNVVPNLVFTGLKIYNKTVRPGELIESKAVLPYAINFCSGLEFTAAQNDFTIGFMGIHFGNASRISYRYKLAGYNKDWIETNFPSVSFANLPVGKYTLYVYAIAGDGVVSSLKQMQIRLLPPWWRSWWAYLLYTMLGIAAGLLAWTIIRRESQLKQNLLIAAKEKELNLGKLEFFTNISHELRTPMTLIYGPLTEFLEKGLNTQNAREKLSQMYRNTKRLLMLTNQLLDFRKMETGNMQMRATRVNIVRFIREIYLVFRNRAEDEGIRYEFHAVDDICLYCDRDKMEIVFTNLLSNAFKYTRSGGLINITLKIKGDPAADALFEEGSEDKKLITNFLEVTITDNGAGIATSELKNIFNSYYQASQASSLSTTGTGLGLSIARGIVQMHKGTIAVESKPNKGCTFTVCIPFGKYHLLPGEILDGYFAPDDVKGYEMLPDNFTDKLGNTVAVPVRNPDPEKSNEGVDQWIETSENYSLLPMMPAPPTSGHKQLYQLLLVEDNHELLFYLKNELANSYQVIIASNGKQGLLKAKQYQPDIIISDVMMPEMDGLEMCRQIKADPELQNIPVILLTARSAAVYEIEGIETGADDYITKPFNFRLLRAKINSFLTGREKVREYYKNLMLLKVAPEEVNNADEKFLNQLLQQVEDSLGDETFSVKSLSQSMAMSQSALYKRTKDVTGGSVVDFVRTVRIRKAAELMLSGKMKINEVANTVGISDKKYFREEFKKHFGHTPTEYLRQHTGEKDS